MMWVLERPSYIPGGDWNPVFRGKLDVPYQRTPMGNPYISLR